MNKAISELKKKTGIFLFVAVTIMVFVLSFFLLRQIFDVRIFELNTYLISINRQGSGKDYLDLVKKYRLYKELYIGR